MKQILPKLREVNKHLKFAKKAFTKRGFRHVQQYLGGLIGLNKKTARQIAKASTEEKHHSAINRILTKARFKQEELHQRYLKKIRYLTRGQKLSLMFDDTLVKREGKCVEEAQIHKNHSGDEEYIRGHQFFTAMIHTPLLQLPLFPKLYSKNTDSKIQMASDLLDEILAVLSVTRVLFDSWYSDKKLIKKCITKGATVYCGVKRNRSISQEKGKWECLDDFSRELELDDLDAYLIDEVPYMIGDFVVKPKGIPYVKLLLCHEWNKREKAWSKRYHLISTDTRDAPVQILRKYSIRWCIETYHRDIKQNLGFAKVFLRKREGIVRHAIFVSLAYAVLKLFMFLRGLTMTIGECIEYIQDKTMDDFIREIVEVQDKQARLDLFEEVFIRRTEKL